MPNRAITLQSKGHWNALEPLDVLDKLDADSCTMPTIVRIWREPPWPMDEADGMLMGLSHCTSNGASPPYPTPTSVHCPLAILGNPLIPT